MSRDEFVTAATAALFAAFCLGWFASWVSRKFIRTSGTGTPEEQRLAEELREAVEERDSAVSRLETREAELTSQLGQTQAELEAAMDGLQQARSENEELRGRNGD